MVWNTCKRIVPKTAFSGHLSLSRLREKKAILSMILIDLDNQSLQWEGIPGEQAHVRKQRAQKGQRSIILARCPKV